MRRPSPSREPFVYSPERYAQLTQVMEWCAPQPYRKSVAHRILNRLAMKDSVPGTDLRIRTFRCPRGSSIARTSSTTGRCWRDFAVPYKVDGKGRAERNESAGRAD